MSRASRRPAPKGWCPGAYRPMMSGDGLVVRVRPMLGRMSRDQVVGFCALAERYGSGILDLTIRANLQMRGVAEADHEALLQELFRLELLPDDPELEARRNIALPFDWQMGDATQRISEELVARLAEFPALPAKFGFAVDASGAPLMSGASADIRIERATHGLILRANGAATGVTVTEDTAVSQMIDLAEWFMANGGFAARRMKALLKTKPLPAHWQGTAPLDPRKRPSPGAHAMGQFFGAAFGHFKARDLSGLILASGASALRTTPWRLFLLEDAGPLQHPERFGDLISSGDDPRFGIDACPGAPMCASATIDTLRLARLLAKHTTKSLHVSGCSKGCARPTPSSLVLIGRNGAFDLVKDGHAWDAPSLTGLTPDDLKTRIGEF